MYENDMQERTNAVIEISSISKTEKNSNAKGASASADGLSRTIRNITKKTYSG